jgi:hypothetical protein
VAPCKVRIDYIKAKTAVEEENNLRQPPLVSNLPGCEEPLVASQHRQFLPVPPACSPVRPLEAPNNEEIIFEKKNGS